MNKYLIIDFDSTFVTVESLDLLVEIALSNCINKEQTLKKAAEITRAGMEGKIPFSVSLQRRLNLFQVHRRHIDELIEILHQKVTPSFAKNESFIRDNTENIYIITGGFRDFVEPVVTKYGIKQQNILANDFVFDENGVVIGVNKNNPLAFDNGKTKVIQRLDLKGEIIILGDGYTDYQTKKGGATSKFWAFGENINRPAIFQHADQVLYSFDDVVKNFTQNQFRSPKVLLLENIHPAAREMFQKAGFEIESIPNALSEKELIEKIQVAEIIGIRSKTEITKEVLDHAKKLKAIGAFCIGTNQIDLDRCKDKDIAVFNAPYQNSRSVAELIIGEIIMLFRKVIEKNNKLQKGVWDKSLNGCFEVKGKKLGIIGYGTIGMQVASLAICFGMDVYFYDCLDKVPMGTAKKCRSLDELLEKSDVVTIHVTGNKSNTNLIAEKEFEKMKNGVILLNMSRGYIVNLQALVTSLQSGKVAGAGIDVYPFEPKNSKDAFESILQGFDNIILTPHIGGNTEEAQEAIGQYVADKLIQFYDATFKVAS